MLPVLLLLLLLVFSSGALRFREAPQFYNSPGCPLPLPPASSHSLNPCGGGSSPLAHIAMTLDSAYLRGSLAAIHSVLHHSSCPQSLLFHFLAYPSSLPSLNSTLSSSFPSLPFLLHPFPPSLVSPLISPSLRPALSRPLNYARSYLPLLLPSCIPRALYLDSDLILLDDIISLAATPLPPPLPLAAPQHCNANFTSYFTPAFWSHPSLPLLAFPAPRANPCYFNTGVMLIDLTRWRLANYTGRIEAWMRIQKRMRIYHLGSLPPFLLVFAGRIAPVEKRWNQHGLGGDNFRGLCRGLHPGPASLLHWSGKGKPWARIDAGRACPIDALWAPYDLLDARTGTFSMLA